LYFSWSRRCAEKLALLSEFLASIESDVLILSNDFPGLYTMVTDVLRVHGQNLDE